MPRRQITPHRWFVAQCDVEQLLTVASSLPRGDGLLLLNPLPPAAMRRLRVVAGVRSLTVAEERKGIAKRVHNARELRAALLARSPVILLSPIYPTRSHPAWKPLPRMRAAAIARLAGRRLIALGGMNEERFAKVAPLGFIGWAGISAFRT